jgi:hypothetical protein
MYNTVSEIAYERLGYASVPVNTGTVGSKRKRVSERRIEARYDAATSRDLMETCQVRKKEYRVRLARQYFLGKATDRITEKDVAMTSNENHTRHQHGALRSTAIWSSSIFLASAIAYGMILGLKWVSTAIHTVR